MAVFTLIIGGFLGVWLLISYLLNWNEMKYKKKGLPPGTMGWPLLGETTNFLKKGPSFMKNQRTRYGNVFKSHLLGCPTVVSMDPETNAYILMNESKGFVPGYPQSMVDILGKSNIGSVQGVDHKNIRGSYLHLMNPTIIKHKIIPQIDDFIRTYLSTWTNQVIDIQEKTEQMTHLLSLKQFAGNESTPLSKELNTEFLKLVLGTFSLPINLPCTNYRRGLHARKKIVKIVKQLIEDRRNSDKTHEDMLSLLMNGDENRYKLNDQEIIDQAITIFYSRYETVSTTSMMAVKYLHDHPGVLEELRKEHIEIREKKKPQDPLDWDDYKSMRFTRAVILETSRLATIVNGVLRKTTKEVELNGYIIPRGWKIYVYTREINYDPCLFPNPYTFNPSRWLQDETLEARNYSFMFGGGTRLCPGKELGIIEISTFLHYFVTNYRWEEIGEHKITKFPRVEAINGLHIRVSTR
uniref:cytochrome P450 85A1-like n=1 Tax=Erigeron canadensis TaxID=72917 RepID=UPI001CB91DAA|nr:cytochrome P450 85A1-like [Erigeron canadensis]